MQGFIPWADTDMGIGTGASAGEYIGAGKERGGDQKDGGEPGQRNRPMGPPQAWPHEGKREWESAISNWAGKSR